MTLSSKSIQSFKDRLEADIGNLLTTLQQHQNALFQLETNDKDPEVLKDLASIALEVGREKNEVFTFFLA
ncbi:MAG: hypothetical protein GYA24_19675 [Candidatus Lokiarchaeota archaeon]|nr:hypothetical protein [Candidatus Lokiarchaeota archaeon]